MTAYQAYGYPIKHPIKVYRELHRIPAADFARAIGKSRATLYKWERGDFWPNVLDLVAIEAVTGGKVRGSSIISWCKGLRQ